MREERLQALGVLRAEPDASSGDHPDHERDARRPAHHEPELGGLVDDLVEGDAGEVRELQLDDGPESRQRRADPAADEAALRQRRVAYPLRAEALVQPLRGPEQPAHLADVLADHDHARIGLELELEGLADGRDEAEQPRGLGCRCRIAALGAEDGGQQVVGARVLVRKRELDRLLDLIVDAALQVGEAIVVEIARLPELALEPRQRVLRLPLLDERRVAHVGQVGAHRVLHAPERLHLEERRACPVPPTLERPRDGVLDSEQVVAVHDLARHAVAGGAVGEILDRALRAPVRGQGELVVLADEDDGQRPRGSEVHRLVRRALPRRAVAEEGNRRLSGAAQARGQRRSARVRQAGAHDPVAAEDVERQVGNVHRAAEPLAVAGSLAEHLGHHPAEIGSGCDQVAVRAVVADEVVRLAHDAGGADGDRLLANAAVGRAEDHALLEQLGGTVLETADQRHQAVLLEQWRPVGGPHARKFAHRGGRWWNSKM